MPSPSRLGGFKVLKDVARVTLLSHDQSRDFPSRLLQAVAEKKINLPYLTCVKDGQAYGLNMLVDASSGEKICGLISNLFQGLRPEATESAILSIFPHRNNPEITGSLFQAFGRNRIEPDAVANSPSATSVVLKASILEQASRALFGPFSFGAYRTPADWKLAQKGKEKLYKEVVASYQEQRPKVYGLEYQKGQELVNISFDKKRMADVGASFRELANRGANINFLATRACDRDNEDHLLFCIPSTGTASITEILNGAVQKEKIWCMAPVATFSMNGPHFGDRYGIASELLQAFLEKGIDVIGLSCTIASITGVVPSEQVERAVESIQSCFEVPSIIKKGG